MKTIAYNVLCFLLAFLFLDAGFDNSKLESEITWNKYRKLTWTDFKGKPLMNEPKFSALTASYISSECGFKHNKLIYNVKAVFLPNDSYIVGKVTDKLLFHEQLHFDLTELYARKLRKMFSEQINTITEADSVTLKIDINAILNEWEKMQHEYDEATYHGLDEVVQNRWQKMIELGLNQLENYSTEY